MKNYNFKKLAVVVLLVAIVCVSVLTLLFAANKTYSAYSTINVPQNNEVTVYVSGNYVTKTDDGNYRAVQGSQVNITVVNESKLFTEMTINGLSYDTAVVTDFTVPSDDKIDIEVTTVDAYAEDKGKYFGNPFVLGKEADVLAVARILAGKSDEADFKQIGAQGKTENDIRYGYFRLGTNLFIGSSEFFGLGFRGYLPFGGCFDFDGYSATINITRTEHDNDEFAYVGNEHIGDYGFFAYTYGDGTNPCLIRNVEVQGFVGINTMNNVSVLSHTDKVNVGGVAGTLGKNVVVDGIESTVSVSAQVRHATLYIGGIFGMCSSSIDSWCDVSYDGAFNNVSGVSYGDNANVVAGAFAGVVQNASIDGVAIDGERSIVLANSLGDNSGLAVAGGFVGILQLGAASYVETQDPRPILMRNVKILAHSEYSVSSVINNSASSTKSSIDPDNIVGNGSSAAVAGGILGIVNRGNGSLAKVDDEDTITLSNIYFRRSEDNSSGREEQRLKIQASTQDAESSGSVFAGGVVGYIFTTGNDKIFGEVSESDKTQYLFECSLDVSATQNGIGPAYAGGMFGYNAFHIKAEQGGKLNVGITSPAYDYAVTACQSATSSKAGTTYYNVCAGGYTSRFNVGYDCLGGTFRLDGGKIKAYREVGSTAIGDVNAGGFAGRMLGYGTAQKSLGNYFNDNSASQSGTFKDFTMYFSDNSSVEAACYSYDSVNNTGMLGNNVCAGGAVGYVLGYSSISNVSVLFEATAQSGKYSEHFVSGTQNAANPTNGDDDLKTEGCIGGVFGLVVDTKLSDITLNGDPTENSVVYFTSANSPNTASVGGLVGALWAKKIKGSSTSTVDGIVMLDGASVKNVHTAGKAYCDKTDKKDVYDIYVGGALGVFANPATKSITITDISVDGCVVDAVGEKTMLTYAGGVVAGMWWSSTTKLTYCVVKNSAVTATSIEPNSYAGGIVGLMQSSTVSYCATIDTDVKASSENSAAYAAGIAARAKNSSDIITYSYSNASLNSSGLNASNSVKYGILALRDSGSGLGDNANAAKCLFVYETAGTTAAYEGDNSGSGSSSRALYLTGNYANTASVETNGTLNVYPAVNNYQTLISVKSHDTNVATVSDRTITGRNKGIAYVGTYCTINGNSYLLCSYPVTVNNSVEDGTGLTLKTDDGETASADNSDAYAEYTVGSGTSAKTYIYFRRNIGNPDTLKKVNLLPLGANYLPQNIGFYDIAVGTTSLPEATYDDDINSRIAAIIAAKTATSVDVSAFNGRANVGFNYESNDDGDAKKSAYFYANDNVRENTVILVECGFGSSTYGVIVEFVPNKLTGITIAPESGTPPLGTATDDDGVVHYMYTAGDVVRFNATLTYHYPAPRSYVVETIYSGDDVLENGMVEVKAGKTYTVNCSDLRKNVFTSVVVEARTEAKFSFAYSGATGTSNRKMVEGCEFEFDISPQPGYGLQPSVNVTVGNVTAQAVFVNDKMQVAFGTQTFYFECDEDDGTDYAYALIASADFVKYVLSNGGEVNFSVSYNKVYTLVFISNYNGNDFRSVSVASGEKFADVDTTELEAWTASLVSKRYGYDFRGFYTVSKASDMSAYGQSFEDMRNDNTSVVSGTMRFYARWTYNVTVEAPQNVKVTSSLSSSMLHDGEMIPLDGNNGFGFVVETSDGWNGTPRFDAFLRQSDGTFVNITSSFAAASQQNGYYVSSESIDAFDAGGCIYLKIYADSTEFYVGDEQRYDGTSLYTDGIFTLTYNVNYGSLDNLADVQFDFATLPLPAGTSLRLYYQKDGKAVWNGESVLSEASNSVSLARFMSMKDGASKLIDELRASATAEKFVVVVTLPNNTNLFGITASAEADVSVANFVYSSTVGRYGDVANDLTDKPDTTDSVDKKTFTLYPAAVKTVTVSGSKFIFAQTYEPNPDVTDHRHNGTRYLWQITKTDGGAIGDVAFDGFGSEVVRTTDGVYYSAGYGEFEVTTSLAGYTVRLIEVKNVQQPSEGLSVFEKDF